VAFVLRFADPLWPGMPGFLDKDAAGYDTLARSILAGRGFPGIYRMPAFPALLAGALPTALVGAACILIRGGGARPGGRIPLFALAAAALVLSAALGLRQAAADYYTDYCYGERGGNEVVRMLADFRRTSGLRVLAANDILHNAGIPESEYRKDRFWNDPAEVAAALRDPATGALVLAVGHTAAPQYAALLGDPAVARALRNGFTLRPAGSYSVWTRRAPGPTAP